MTGLESRSLGGVEYRRELAAVGLKVMSEYEDEGQNHNFDARAALTLQTAQHVANTFTPDT
jgi:hypothetical protein